MKTPQTSFFREALGVFFFAVFCVYSWTLLVFFWDLPAFLLRFSSDEIIGFLSYQLMYALAESAIVALGVIFLVFLIPVKRARAKLSAAGGLLVLSFAVSAIIFKQIVPLIAWLVSFSVSLPIASGAVFTLWLFALLGLPVLSIAALKNKKVAEAASNFAENLSVLAFIYVILGVAGSLMVLYRNF